MSLQRLMTQSVTVQPVGPSTLDAYGNSVLGPLGVAVSEFGFLEQMDTVEFLDARQTTVTHWHAFLSAASVVTATAYLTFSAQKFQVSGEPWHVYNPRTKAVSHIQCKLTEVT